jgi:HK97 gp10 family phage protein
MPSKATELVGYKEARETLHELSKAMQRGVGKRALHTAGQILVQATKANAPVSSDPNDKTPGSLKAAPRTVNARPGKRAEAAVAILVEDAAAVRVEFGSVHNVPAEPFFRPAIDSTKDAMGSAFGAALAVEVVAAAERAAKRKAKAAK